MQNRENILKILWLEKSLGELYVIFQPNARAAPRHKWNGAFWLVGADVIVTSPWRHIVFNLLLTRIADPWPDLTRTDPAFDPTTTRPRPAIFRRRFRPFSAQIGGVPPPSPFSTISKSPCWVILLSWSLHGRKQPWLPTMASKSSRLTLSPQMGQLVWRPTMASKSTRLILSPQNGQLLWREFMASWSLATLTCLTTIQGYNSLFTATLCPTYINACFCWFQRRNQTQQPLLTLPSSPFIQKSPKLPPFTSFHHSLHIFPFTHPFPSIFGRLFKEGEEGTQRKRRSSHGLYGFSLHFSLLCLFFINV